VVQAAPTGFSAFVDHEGTVVARSGITEPATLQHRAELRSGRTIASYVGDLPALALGGALLAAAWVAHRRTRGRPVPDDQPARTPG
jgi:apolipoprotein N-acyltransferase